MHLVFQIIIALLVFGFLIFIHELGHFTVGKLSGMRVNEFAIGMGPALFSWERKETRYSLRLLPIGGFVAVEGEDENSDDPRAFGNTALWKRILFVCAGAAMNLLFGFIILSILVGMRTALPTTAIGGFYDNARSSAWLQKGDQIVAVNGSHVFSANDISFSMVIDRDGIVDFTVLRDGKKINIQGVDFGMQEFEDGTRAIQLDFYVGQVPNTFLGGAKYSVQWMFSIVRQVWLSFINLITGNFKISEMSGPVGVTSAIGQASTMGFTTLFNLVGFITVNIGVFNLLPVPALDGGRLLFLLIELVSRRKVPAKFEGMVHAIGLVLLLGLIAVVSFNDIMRLF